MSVFPALGLMLALYAASAQQPSVPTPKDVAPLPANRTITLAWDASISCCVTGNCLYWGTASLVYNNTVWTGTNLTIVLSIPKGFDYFFAVTCKDYYGLESDYSKELALIRPLPKTNLVVTVVYPATGLTLSLTNPMEKQRWFTNANIYKTWY